MGINKCRICCWRGMFSGGDMICMSNGYSNVAESQCGEYASDMYSRIGVREPEK